MSGHIERMGNEEFDKVYLRSVEDTNGKGRPLRRWEDRVREYVSESGVRGNGLDWARREWMDRERWRSVCHGHPLWGRFRREQGIGDIDFFINEGKRWPSWRLLALSWPSQEDNTQYSRMELQKKFYIYSRTSI